MNTNELRAWAEIHDVEKKTIEYFKHELAEYIDYYNHKQINANF